MGTWSSSLGLGWEAAGRLVGEVRGRPETIHIQERNSSPEGKSSLYSAMAKCSEISKLIFGSFLLTRAELT